MKLLNNFEGSKFKFPKWGIWLILISISILIHENGNVEANPDGRIITIPQGRVKDRYSESRDGRFFLEYFVIAYAEPPKRFKIARWPAPSRDGVRDGTKRALPCFQMKAQIQIGSEDCLTLNVHTPATHQNFWLLKNLPVLVVFHGGGWMADRGDWNGGESDQFGAKHMMDEDCVIISVNYRLGVLGFFSIFNEQGPANLGLKDQSMALKWVKENIGYFGGNSSQVTIVGQGAGAAAVGLHLLSPMSKGLFHRAIMQSGSPLCHWAVVDDKQMLGLFAFLTQLGCDTVAEPSAVECVEGKGLEEIEQARQKIMTTFDDPAFPFGPVVEHWVRSNPKMRVFLPDYPMNILSNGTANSTWVGIPIIMGVNSQDGLTFVTGQYLYNSGYKQEYFTNYTRSWPPNMGFGPSTELFPDEDTLNGVVEKIRNFYYEGIPVEEMSLDQNHQIHVDLYSHRNYFQCVKNAAVLFGKQTEVYLYYWSRVGSSLKKWHGYDKLALQPGVAHGDEVHFLFDTADDYGDFMLIRESRPKNVKFSKNVVRIWIQFAALGKPVDEWTSMKGKDKPNLEWYLLGDERMMGKEPFTKFTDFWDNLGMDVKKLPPAGEIQKKTLGKKEGKDEEGVAGENGQGFIYIDVDSAEG